MSLTQRLLGRGQAAPDQGSDRCICGRNYLLMLAPSVDGCEHVAIKRIRVSTTERTIDVTMGK
jgi:hypothetical protein